MAVIHPFKGSFYNCEKVHPEKVITQPYDKIDSKLHQTYLDRDPHNMVRIILKGLTEQENGAIPYQTQAKLLEEWIRNRVLIQDHEPAIYGYTQEFDLLGERRRRQAFIALGRLENYENKIVYPHEETLSKPKADRLNHLKATQTQFGLIFMLYEDPQREILKALNPEGVQKILFEFTDPDYGVSHRVWSIKDPIVLDKITRAMQDKKLLIADGHHRYETALAFRDEMRKKQETDAFDYAMMAFVNLYDEGLVILPTHRLVRHISDDTLIKLTDTLRKDFRIERLKLPADHQSTFIHEKMKKIHPNHHVIGLYFGSEEFLLLHYLKNTLSSNQVKGEHSEIWRGLDVAILHTAILKEILKIQDEAVRTESNLNYCREIDEALDAVNKGRAQLAFILNPTQPEVVRDIAYHLERMPQKSTDFYPKLMTGLMLNRMRL